MSSFSLRTIAGPIGLREKREPVTLQVEGSGEKVILKDWLREQQDYHKCVFQTMLLAGVDQKIFDAADPLQKGYTTAMVSELNSKRRKILEGRERVAVAASKKLKLHKVENRDQRERDALVKFSKHMCPQSMNRRERTFIIENGEILVYKGHAASAKLKTTYKLKDATCNIEFRGAVQYPMWDEGYDSRLRVDTQERQLERKMPIYLYAKDKQKVNRWRRAFQLARHLTSENDRRSLRTSIGRAVSGSLKKGWESLFAYHKEISSTKQLVRHMAVRLKAVEISRGYTKLTMAYREHVEAQRVRTEQQLWAARFMSEKLAKLGSTNAKSAADVRESVITRIQSRFRRFRDDRIFERTYALNQSSAVSKTQQAKMGRSFDFLMRSVKCPEALSLSFPSQSEEFKSIASLTQMVKTRKPSYSEVNFAACSSVHVFVTDNLTSLSFGNDKAVNGEGHHALSKADWTKFVNLDRISSVVLFTEPVPGATLQNGEKDAGVWFTINGPRLSWCKKVDERGNVVGVPDGLKLAESIACDFGRNWDSVLVPTYKGGSSPSSTGKPDTPEWKGPAPVWWQEFVVKIGGVDISNYTERENMSVAQEPTVSIKIVAHVFGYTFEYIVPLPEKGLDGEISIGAQSEKVLGFPVPANEKGSLPAQQVGLGEEEPTEEANERGFEVMLESSEVAVEVFEVREYGPDDVQTELLCVGSELLPKIMGFDTFIPKDFVDQGQRPEYDLKLAGAFKAHDKITKDKSTSSVNIMISPKGQARPRLDWKSSDYLGDRGVPVSPEFVGAGVTTAFFTSHRGSWYDPNLGPGKFRADHVANYVELCLQALRFPKADNKPSDFGKKYIVKASLYGFSATSPVLTRPMPHWADVVASSVTTADPKIITQVIKFQGSRLFIPLPPGCWCTNFRNKRTILIQVFKIEDSIEATNAIPRNYSEFISSATPTANKTPKDGGRLMTPVYQTSIVFDNVLVDFLKPVSAYLADLKAQKKDGYKIPQVDVMHNVVDGDVTDGVLNMDFALRDRDYVKAMTGGCTPPQVAEGTVSEKKSLCIGDKAILLVEEAITYPPVKATIWKEGRSVEDPDYGKKEFRKRMFPGQFDAKRSDDYARKREYKGYKDYAARENWTGTYTNLWPEDGIELRAPMLSSEYAESDLANLTPKEKFKQAFIPNFCKDIVPHSFVLPLSEQQFQQMHYPGVYSKIIDQIDKQRKDAMMKGESPNERKASGVKRNVVRKLTCFTKPIPVTLLAVYADGTCDVEILSDFMKAWKNQPYRRYAIPGKLRTDPKKTVQQAQRGSQRQSAQPTDAEPPRAVVKRVTMAQLQAVHGAGFNIYDANFWTTDDVVEKKGAPQSDFDPRIEEGADRGVQAEEKKRFSLPAGPLPPDALNSTCQYEWSVRMRASNETEMYKFIALLRRCVRLDNFQQATKMMEYQNQQAAEAPMLAQQAMMQNARPLFGGQLDVLLVEARRLNPTPWLLNRPELKFYDEYVELQGTTSAGKAVKATPKGNQMVSTFVNFRILNNKTVVPFRGQKVQQSAKCPFTDSPHWASMDEYRNTGGCLFRTGTIDPERYPDLLMDLEVMQTGPFSMIPSRIGAIQIPITQKQFLCNPEEPFKNLWVPLVSVDNKVATANKTGELHLMCRWLPADKIPQGPTAPLMQTLSVKNAFQKEIWPRICAQRLREPIYNLEVQYLHYNPNLVRDGLAPEKPKDHIQRHAEELYNAVNYLECLERRMQGAWAKFEHSFGDNGRVRISDMRLRWISEPNDEMLNELQDLIRRGIPSAQRAEKWAELTLASRIMEKEGVNGSRIGQEAMPGQNIWEREYEDLLEKGNTMRNDAMSQLAEDCFNLSQWETATPPIPELFDKHLKRIKQASNVCTALIVTARDGSGLVYCESLLILAFFMCLPQGNKEEKGLEDLDSNYHYMSESQVFWLLYTLICTTTNGTYKDYYGSVIPQATQTSDIDSTMHGKPARPSETLVSGSGAMEDVHLLECNVAYHLSDVWQKMNAIGFQLSTVFYGAFMRLYATFMPTSTVFRLWDMLFYASTDPKAIPSGRCYLIDLAFGVIKSSRGEILKCQSAQEVKHLILGVLGHMYDMSTVIDIVLQANIWLWGGGGFGMGKVSQDLVQRVTLFDTVNRTTQRQNEALKQLCHVEQLGKVGTVYKGSCPNGVSTRELSNEVINVLKNSLQNCTSDRSRRVQGRFWFMHRPLPLCGGLLCQTAVDQAWEVVKSSLDIVSQRPILPRLIPPPQSGTKTTGLDVSRPVTCIEPAGITSSDFAEAIQRDIPAWVKHSGDIWVSFKNRQDLVYGMGVGGAIQAQIFRTHDDLIDDSQRNEGLTAGGIWKKIFGSNAGHIYQPFCNQDGGLGGEAETISLNELIVSLLVGSKGTVGEKAAALFQYFAYTDEDLAKVKQMYHSTPVSKVAKSVTASADQQNTMDRNVSPPEHGTEEAQKNSLCFTVYSNYPTRGTVVGYVYIPLLGPFVSYDSEAEWHHFNIWGKPAPQRRNQASFSQGAQATAAWLAGKKAVQEEITYRFTPTVNNKSDQQIIEAMTAKLKEMLPSKDAMSENDFKSKLKLEVIHEETGVRGMQLGGGDQSNSPLMQQGLGGISGGIEKVLAITGDTASLDLLREHCKRIEPFKDVFADEQTRLVAVGDIEMALSWTPKSIRAPEEGQLMVNVKGIKFNKFFVSDYYKMNPWVKLTTFMEGGSISSKREEKAIPRWEPRGILKTGGQESWLTTHGAFGGEMHWEQTMRDNLVGQQGQGFSQHIRDGSTMGFNQQTERWEWNEVWGKQYSIENFTFMKEFVQLSTRKNVMDLHACRLVTSSILQRAMLNLTNRQALLISDAIFNRQGVVPGIIEAYLIQGKRNDLKANYQSLAEILNSYETKVAKGKPPVDITNKLAIEHEKQIAYNGGLVNLFVDSYVGTGSFALAERNNALTVTRPKNINLEAMGIKDPFPRTNKTIWIRYVCGGDGERKTEIIEVDGEGNLVPLNALEEEESYECALEKKIVDPSTPHNPMLPMKIGKEEFVSCVMASPLLSESIRRLGFNLGPSSTTWASKLSFDVTIMDPHQEEEDQEFLETLDIQQSLLFEVWDSDVMSKDFLGEAWLPPLAQIGPRPKDFVLPLQKADFGEDAENGPSREANKNSSDDPRDISKQVSGELYVTVSWKYPGYVMQDDEQGGSLVKADADGGAGAPSNIEKESMSNRAKIQEKLHTGILTIKIEKAKHLRRADAKKGRACDPQVLVWVRNDANGMWRKRPLVRTPVKSNTRDPVWNYEPPHGKSPGEYPELLAGDYEARFPPIDDGFFAEAKAMFRTKRQKQFIENQRNTTAVKRFGKEGIKITFRGDGEDTNQGLMIGSTTPNSIDLPAQSEQAAKDNSLLGKSHKVDIFNCDSIRQFKSKLTQACEKEAFHWENMKGPNSKEARMYKNIQVGYRHLVMVFVGSANLLRLHNQKMHNSPEYHRAYEQAEADPSCWQPLDPARSFSQYPQFGFGKRPQKLRVVEGTEAYKLTNLRYKQYDIEQRQVNISDRDTEKECFAWAKYVHETDRQGPIDQEDGPRYFEPTYEWRPCLASLPEDPSRDSAPTVAAAKAKAAPKLAIASGIIERSYKVKMMVDPPKPEQGKAWPEPPPEIVPDKKWMRNQAYYEDTYLVQKTNVLLKPRTPLFDGLWAKEHSELLVQAEILRKCGKSDFEIAGTLDKALKDKTLEENRLLKEQGKPAVKQPPPITIDVVRSYMHQQEAIVAKTNDEQLQR